MDVAELRVVVGADVSDADHALDALGSKVESFGSTFGRVFTVAAAAGTTALVAGLGSAIGEASKFESTMSGVAAVSGASATEMKRLSDLALQLGADTSFSAGEAGKGIEELVKAGVSVSDVMGGAAKAALDLAAAGGISVADAATIASNAMNQFNIKGKDLAGVADLIAGAANASAIDVGQFQFSLSAVGAVANTVGLSFKDTAVAIAEMGQAGIVGSDAGTSLKTMLLALQPSTKAATDEFKKLGLITATGANQFFDAQGHIKSLADVQQILQKATAGMTDQQRLATLQILFGTDAVRAAAVLAKDGAAGFNEMATAMGKVSAADVAEKRLDNLAGSIEKLKGSLSTVAIQVGEALTPSLRKAADGATAMVNAWTPAIAAFAKRIPVAIGATVSAISSTVSWLGHQLQPVIRTTVTAATAFARTWTPTVTAFATSIPTAIRATITTVSSLASWLGQQLRPAVQWVITNASTFQGAFLGAAAAIGGLLASQAAVAVVGAIGGALAALLSPITLIVVASAALGAAWATDWGGIREITTSVIAWITSTGLPSLLGGLQSVVSWLRSTLQPAIAAATGVLREQLGGALTWLAQTAWPNVQDAMGAVATWVTGTLVPTLTVAWDWLRTRLGDALGWLTQTGWPALQTAAQGVASWLQATWQTAVIAVWYWLRDQLGGALTTLSTTVWPAFQTAMTTVWGWITGTLIPTLGSVWEWLSPKLGAALGGLTSVGWPLLQGAMTAVWTWITSSLIPTLSSVWDWLSPKFQAALGWLTSTGWPALQGAMSTAWTFISGPFMSTLASLWDWLSPKLQAALTWLTVTGWPALQAAAQGFWSWLTTSLFPALSEWYDWLQQRLSPIYTWFITYGWPALQSAGSAVMTWLTASLFPVLSEWWNWLQARLSPIFTWFISYGWPTLQSAGAAFWSWLTTSLIPALSDWWHWMEEKARPSAEWWIGTGFPNLGIAGKGYFGVLQDVIKWQKGLNDELAKTDNAESWVTIFRNLGQFGKYLIEHIDLAGWFRNIGSGSGQAAGQVGYIAEAIAWISRTLAKWSSFLPGVHPPDVGDAPKPPGGGGGGGGGGPSIPALPAPITSGPGGGGPGGPSAPTPGPGGPSVSPVLPPLGPGDWYVPSIGVAAQWGNLINAAHYATGVPTTVIAAIMDIESAGKQDAESPMNRDRNGRPIGRAQGLMQIMPFNFGVQVGPDGEATAAQKALMQDPATNVNKGAAMLGVGFSTYGTWDKSALAYFGALGNPNATDATGTSGAKYLSLFHAALQKYGQGWMPPNLALGGIVKAMSGGTLAMIGEAGRDEAVIPLPHGWRSTLPTSGGDTYVTLDLRNAQVYDGSKFEDLLVSALDRAGRGGRIVKVTR